MTFGEGGSRCVTGEIYKPVNHAWDMGTQLGYDAFSKGLGSRVMYPRLAEDFDIGREADHNTRGSRT
jgi:hypothetical protein